MAYALIFIGIVLFVSAIRGDVTQLASLLKRDLFSGGNFLYWLVAIFVLGALGYIKQLKPFSDAFLVLVIVVFVVANKGFFAQFQAALAQIKAGNCPQTPSTNTGSSLSGNSLSQANDWLNVMNSGNITPPVPSTSTEPPAGMLSITVTPSAPAN